jgi:hypothetical protein
MMNKRAELMSGETLELILGGAAIIVLLTLFFMILAPAFNRPEETAKSYANLLEKQLMVAEGGGIGEIEISKVPKGGEVYIIYFGSKIGMGVGGTTFFNPSADDYSISVCYSNEGIDNKCYFKKSSYPLRLEGKDVLREEGKCIEPYSCLDKCQEGQKEDGGCLIYNSVTDKSFVGKCCAFEEDILKTRKGWFFSKGEKIQIKLEKGEYVFKKVT